MNIIIPIGGEGKRFKAEGYTTPKPLIRILGKPMIFWVIENLKLNGDDKIFIAYNPELEQYNFSDVIKFNFSNIDINFIKLASPTRGAAETVLCCLNCMSKEDLEKTTLTLDCDIFYTDDIITKDIENKNCIYYFKDYDKNPIYSYIKYSEKNIVTDCQEKNKISDNANAGAYCFRNGNILKYYCEKIIKDLKRTRNEYYISNIYQEMLKEQEIIYAKEIKNFYCLGTPFLIKCFANNQKENIDFNHKIRFCFDLDNTLVTYPDVIGDYSTVRPIIRNINLLKFLHKLGHTIIIYTARRMKTHSGNAGAILADIGEITFNKLKEFDIPYDEIYFGKPYANFYIDDLAIKPDEHVNKEIGFYDTDIKEREFNSIVIGDEYVYKIIKTDSSDTFGLNGEKYWWQNIPNKIRHLFPELIEIKNNVIKTEKINGISYSYLYVNNTITDFNIEILLNKLNKIHQVKVKNKSENIYSNYSIKLKSRFDSFDYGLILPGIPFENIIGIFNKINNYLEDYEEQDFGLKTVIHGDPVFSNIIIDKNNNIKFIDMRGKCGDILTLNGDVFYDYAKIYQSIIGYDFILHDREMNINYIQNIREKFESLFVDMFSEYRLTDLKYLTASLLFSLIPLHNNEKCLKYFGLINTLI